MGMNSITLAFIGDAVYEVYIRDFLVKKYGTKVNDLQKRVWTMYQLNPKENI